MKIIKKVGHLPRRTIIEEWTCPPNCPECKAEYRAPNYAVPVLNAPTPSHRPLMGNIYCQKCNRWGDHDEEANHGD